jgi:leucyl-tRNA synthetase
VVRFLNRVWDCVLEPSPRADTPPDEKSVRTLRRRVHQAIRKGTQDLESFSFNTYIANLMELNNALIKARETAAYGTAAWQEATEALLLMLAPACPHVAEEMWEQTGRAYSIHHQAWPTWDEGVAAEEMITLVVQVNGKVRDRIEVPVDVDEQVARGLALQSEGAQRSVGGKRITNVVYVPGRLVNIVVQ